MTVNGGAVGEYAGKRRRARHVAMAGPLEADGSGRGLRTLPLLLVAVFGAGLGNPDGFARDIHLVDFLALFLAAVLGDVFAADLGGHDASPVR
jgi:hypothetical protein